METAGVWLLGWYLIGPFKVMVALLSSMSTETSGGPKLAIEIDGEILNILSSHLNEVTKKIKLSQKVVDFLKY